MHRYLISRYSSMPYFEPSRPMPGFLDAAERRDFGGDEAGVDADHAVLERFGRRARCGRCRGRRNTPRGRTRCRWPCAIASSSVLKRNSGATGPKVSSCVTCIVGVDVGEHGRLEELCRPARGACRRSATLRALGDRVGDVLLDLRHRVLVDQRALRRRRLSAPLPTFSALTFVGELRGERVVDACPARRMRLAQTQVWPVLRNLETIAPFDRRIEVGIVEHDERRIAAQLQRDLLDRVGALRASACCRLRSSR